MGLDVSGVDTTGLDDLIAGIETEFGALENPLDALVGTWGELFDENKAGDVLGAALDVVGQKMAAAMLSGFSSAMSNAYANWVDTVNQNVLGAMAAPLEDARANGKGLINAMIDAGVMEEAIGRLITWSDDIAIQIETWTSGLATTIGTWLSTQATNLSTWFTERLTDVTTWLGNVWTTFSTKMTELGTLISTKWEEYKTSIETWWGKAQTFLEDIDLLQVGKDILDGLWSGLKNKWSGIKKWLEDKAALVEGIWRKISGTQSPSKKMQAVGLDLMGGLELGMETRWAKVERSAARMADSLMGGFSSSALAPVPAGMSMAMSGLALGGPTSGDAGPTERTLHLILDIPGMGRAIGQVTENTKTGEMSAGRLTLHGTSKSV